MTVLIFSIKQAALQLEVLGLIISANSTHKVVPIEVGNLAEKLKLAGLPGESQFVIDIGATANSSDTGNDDSEQ